VTTAIGTLHGWKSFFQGAARGGEDGEDRRYNTYKPKSLQQECNAPTLRKSGTLLQYVMSKFLGTRAQ
jgi:hypothetical protein